MISGTDAKLRSDLQAQLGKAAFRDEAPVNLYRDLDGVRAKEHKLIRVRVKDGVKEISDFADTIIGSHLKQDVKLVRYYFLDRDEFEHARRIMEGG